MDLTGTIRPCTVTIWIKDLIRSLESPGATQNSFEHCPKCCRQVGHFPRSRPLPSRRELLILSGSHFLTQDGTTHDTRS